MAISPSQPPGADLPEDGPVVMPTLPPKLVLTTEQQLKALADAQRTRILVLLQYQPATAKQIADRLGVLPGSVGHHLQVLEDAGLAQVVARRIIHGIVAKYYTRSARLFILDFPREVMGASSVHLQFLKDAHDELAETPGDQSTVVSGFPHVRLSAERAQIYRQRLEKLFEDLVREPAEPEGQVYGLVAAFFLAPSSLQISSTSDTTTVLGEHDTTT